MTAGGLTVSDLVVRLDRSTVLDHLTLLAEPGSVTALVGPSGSGKTTLLRTIAGLVAPDAGRIEIDGVDVIAVPAERRGVGLVFQTWALFPHLNVLDNVRYGLSRSERTGPRAGELLERFELTGLERRSPAELSGGQQQRVALARALAPQPRVLLLDEPFSNLDPTLRRTVRRDVRNTLHELGVTAVLVTHDREEAFLLGDQVAVLHEGRVAQQADPGSLYRRPTNEWVAMFVGDGIVIDGVASNGVATTALGPVVVDRAGSGPVRVVIRPEQVALGPVAVDRPSPQPEATHHAHPVAPAVIEQVIDLGTHLELTIRHGTLTVPVRARSDDPMAHVGASVTVTVAGRSTAWPRH